MILGRAGNLSGNRVDLVWRSDSLSAAWLGSGIPARWEPYFSPCDRDRVCAACWACLRPAYSTWPASDLDVLPPGDADSLGGIARGAHNGGGLVH